MRIYKKSLKENISNEKVAKRLESIYENVLGKRK